MKYSEPIEKLTGSIRALDVEAMEKAERRQDELAKPPGSLGRLEELSVRLAGITGSLRPVTEKKTLLVFCADNGVVCEGVASAPQSVTAAQTVNLTLGKTGAAVLAKRFGCEVMVCDVGVNADISAPGVINRKIAYGTADIAKGRAMSAEQAERAVLTGAQLAIRAVSDGAQVIGVGEMGIGNTTTASAVLSALTGRAVPEVTGRGAGITDEAYRRKIEVIGRALAVNRPDRENVIDVLSAVGGFDIAAMCGAFLGGASARVPVVIDGFISAAAALCAYRMCPLSREYMIPSHASFEIGICAIYDELGLRPLLDLGMRLGEGSGCPLAMTLLDAASAVICDMATFEEASIDDSYLAPIRSGDAFTVRREEK